MDSSHPPSCKSKFRWGYVLSILRELLVSGLLSDRDSTGGLLGATTERAVVVVVVVVVVEAMAKGKQKGSFLC